jgi:hypothetical protein
VPINIASRAVLGEFKNSSRRYSCTSLSCVCTNPDDARRVIGATGLVAGAGEDQTVRLG